MRGSEGVLGASHDKRPGQRVRVEANRCSCSTWNIADDGHRPWSEAFFAHELLLLHPCPIMESRGNAGFPERKGKDMEATMTAEEFAQHEAQCLLAEKRTLVAQLENLKRLVTWLAEGAEDEGTEAFAIRIASQGGSSGTVGATWQEMVATANRIVAKRDLVRTMAILATRV